MTEYNDINEIDCKFKDDKISCNLYSVDKDRERDYIATIENIDTVQSESEEAILQADLETPVNLYLIKNLVCEVYDYEEKRLLICKSKPNKKEE